MAKIQGGAGFRPGDMPDDTQREAVSIVAEDGGGSRGVLYRLRGTRPRVGVHLMRPNTAGRAAGVGAEAPVDSNPRPDLLNYGPRRKPNG